MNWKPSRLSSPTWIGWNIRNACNVHAKAGHIITLDAIKGELSVDLSDEELAARREAWSGPKETIYASGALWKYAQLVGSAKYGACTHPGASKEAHVYMDL